MQEKHGLAVIDGLEWRGELIWLRDTLRALVRGQQSYDDFTSTWWEQNAGVADK